MCVCGAGIGERALARGMCGNFVSVRFRGKRLPDVRRFLQSGQKREKGMLCCFDANIVGLPGGQLDMSPVRGGGVLSQGV